MLHPRRRQPPNPRLQAVAQARGQSHQPQRRRRSRVRRDFSRMKAELGCEDLAHAGLEAWCQSERRDRLRRRRLSPPPVSEQMHESVSNVKWTKLMHRSKARGEKSSMRTCEHDSTSYSIGFVPAFFELFFAHVRGRLSFALNCSRHVKGKVMLTLQCGSKLF